MGKLIRMGVQERRLRRPKRLHWSRLLFLLGMLIIGSTYQHLRRPRNLLSPWAEVSSQQPLRLASRDLLSDDLRVVSSEPAEASSEMESDVPAPQGVVDVDEATPSLTMEDTPTPPRTTKASRTAPENKDSPTAAGTGRARGNAATTPGSILGYFFPQTVRSYPPSPRGERQSSSPTHLPRAKGRGHTSPPAGGRAGVQVPPTSLSRETGHSLSPTTASKDSDTLVTYRVWETSPPRRMVGGTAPATLKRLVRNTPTWLSHEVETNLLTSPGTVEKTGVGSARRGEGEGSASPPWRPTGTHKLTTPQGAVPEHPSATSQGQVTISNMAGSSPARTRVSATAWSVRNPSAGISAPTTRTTSDLEMARIPSTAPGTSITPKVRTIPATQVHHCVFVEPAPAMPATPSSSLLPDMLGSTSSPLPPDWASLHPQAEYPPDLFSVEERRQGWVALHVFGMMYVFVALAIVCDEYFVPALGVITDKLQISEDVAGATFMAAGGSAPELFTSLIGVFISHSNVGIGTIVGSAVFNILFVIGTCALFSREILNLTWWPLFRDVSFYILDLSMLILFFLDSLIAWWESLLLLLAYALYVFAMKWNKQIELWVKEQLSKRPMAKVMALGDLNKPGNGATTENEQEDNKKLKLPSVLTRGSSSASLHNSIIRSTIYHLMLHSLDPLGEARPSKDKQDSLTQEARAQPQAKAESSPDEEEPAELPAVTVTPAPAADVKGDQEEDPSGQEGVDGAEGTEEMTGEDGETQREGETEAEGKGEEHEGETEAEGKGDECEGETEAEGKGDEREGETEAEEPAEDGEVRGGEAEVDAKNEGEAKDEKGGDGEEGSDGGDSEEEEEEDDDDDEEDDDDEDEDEEREEPLSLEWPESRQKQAIYLFLLPIVFPLWLTVPDVRRQESRKFFVVTFLGSIIWIAMFSYLMVWWAHQVGETIGISEEIMGLTILAAGTSIPDLITSVIVARKGLGDMAVSSSVGSNIFDITVGLPVPWLLFSLFNTLQPVPVSSNGLFCAIVLLFLMLLFVIFSIASCKWRMNKILGFTMFLLYFVFLIISVMLEDRIISCPVSV
uniref:sodium/potassium/calcium exchanger 1 isoform X2 n=1 Tax=Jaculus jaculus TaxID=51337 RepID=UPI0003334AAC|nr:sodium/potassium/calcium exchanger 1 isoform X2 [Jaculus jaculus]